jgi:hypothetical protein
MTRRERVRVRTSDEQVLVGVKAILHLGDRQPVPVNYKALWSLLEGRVGEMLLLLQWNTP